MQNKRYTVSCTISAEQYEKLKKYAEKNKTSIYNVLKQYIVELTKQKS